jgi:hypothetical protein
MVMQRAEIAENQKTQVPVSIFPWENLRNTVLNCQKISRENLKIAWALSYYPDKE